ncbi:MAG: hypothetical protein ACLPJH_06335 [Myxococcaceae bacterium]
MQTLRVVTVAVLATSLIHCSSSSTSGPTAPVTVSVAPSTQAQTVQIPMGGGPVTGSVNLPPITTVPPNAGGDLTLGFLSGSNVPFVRAFPEEPQSFAKERSSNATFPGGPYLFVMTITAPFGFTLASVPGFTLNLGTLGSSAPNAAYVLVVEAGAGATYQFPTTAQSDVISFPGASQSLTVAANGVMKFGIALASNVPPNVNSFTASPSSLAADGGSVVLAWNVSGATALSIDNGVGSVTPVSAGTATANVTASTTFNLSATGAGGTTTASAPVCVAGPVTAVITSPTSYTACNDSFLTSIVMTNGSCQVVTISVIGFISTVSGVGTCGFNGPSDYTSANADLPFSVDAGATETVFDLTNGQIGCCTTQPCSIDCNDTLQWTLMTNIGPVSALSQPFIVNVSNCNLALCPP